MISPPQGKWLLWPMRLLKLNSLKISLILSPFISKNLLVLLQNQNTNPIEGLVFSKPFPILSQEDHIAGYDKNKLEFSHSHPYLKARDEK